MAVFNTVFSIGPVSSATYQTARARLKRAVYALRRANMKPVTRGLRTHFSVKVSADNCDAAYHRVQHALKKSGMADAAKLRMTVCDVKRR